MKTLQQSTNVLFALTVSSLISCAPAMAASTAKVVIGNFTFDPPVLQVDAGTTVTWENQDDMPHMVASADSSRVIHSPAVDSGERYSATFTQAGTYKYFCSMHPRMTGTVIVR